MPTNIIITDYQRVRQRTEELCRPLNIEDYVPQPVYFASPVKWHIAHTTWFFEEMILKKHLVNYQEFDSDFNFLFNSYYNTVGDRVLRAERGNLTRPTVEEVINYRKHVDSAMNSLLATNSNNEVLTLVELGLNHEQQHQELLIADLKYSFGHNPIFPVYDSKLITINQTNSSAEFVSIDEGVYEIGHQENTFSFDNELGVHKVYINKCKVCSGLVTNSDYIEFIESGGYSNFNYWLDEGWNWLSENNISSPLYWHKINGVWHQYTLAGFVKVEPNNIVTHVSYYEAAAYAQYKQMRLPTEFEWEVANTKFKWGDRWEWTNSAYLPYPNFKIAKGAVGEYNGKFMVNQMVLRGGSVATAKGHSRSTYRNFFHPHFQWQFTGIRLVK